MILLPCPWCGPRDAAEFHYAGEATPRPDPATATPEAWRAYLYLRDNPCGWTTETWYHRMGCRRYLTVRRHTLTNEVTTAVTGAVTGGAAGADAAGDEVTGGAADAGTAGPAAAGGGRADRGSARPQPRPAAGTTGEASQ